MIPFGSFKPSGFALNYVSGSGAADASSVTNATLTLGTAAAAGDLIVVACRNSGTSGTDATMSGYTKAWRAPNSSAATRFYFFYRIATGTETTVPTLSNSLAHRRAAAVYRPSRPIVSVSVGTYGWPDLGPNIQVSGDPPAQVLPVTSGNFPALGLALYCEDGGAAIATRTFSVSGVNRSNYEGQSSFFWGKFGVFNSTEAADLSVDMPDSGTSNVMASILLRIT